MSGSYICTHALLVSKSRCKPGMEWFFLEFTMHPTQRKHKSLVWPTLCFLLTVSLSRACCGTEEAGLICMHTCIMLFDTLYTHKSVLFLRFRFLSELHRSN